MSGYFQRMAEDKEADEEFRDELEAENAALRARVEKLEKVRDAARICANNTDGQTAGEAQAAWNGLEAALAECGEVGRG